MEEKILTLHPQGKKGVNISKAKYEQVRRAILDALKDTGVLTFADLLSAIEARLAGNFEGAINWYTTTVKLDLEARGEIERVPGSNPQELRLTR